MELAAAPAAQIRDAEMSVEYLCRKFETLSDQLRHEEQAREAMEQRGAELAAEVASAEAAAWQRSNAIAVELTDKEASIAALRATASEADRRATLETTKAREEQAAETRLERECAALSERCRSEAASSEQVSSRLAVLDREAAHERGQHGEIGRRLRQMQADTRVSLEDLRIAQQRSLLVRSEFHTLEASLESRSRARENAGREADSHTQQLQDHCLQLRDSEVRLEAMVASLQGARSEGAMQDRRLCSLRDEEGTAKMQLAVLQKDLQSSQQEARTFGLELHAELEASKALAHELGLVEHRRGHDALEASALRRSLVETEGALESVRKNTAERHLARETATGHLGGLTAEEEGHAIAAGELRRARHLEDLAFGDAQSELQIALKRRESLSEDLAAAARTREDLLAKMSWMRPESIDVEERIRQVEEALAQRARDVEEEIVQQRHFQEEVVAVSDSLLQAQREEARSEAALHHAAIFQRGTSPSRTATFAGDALGSRGGSRAGSPSGRRPRSPAPHSAFRVHSSSHAGATCSPRPAAGRHRGSSAPWASPSPAPRLLASSLRR